MNEQYLGSAGDAPASRSRTPDEIAVALCIYGEDLDPNEITSLLGVEATRAHRRGAFKVVRHLLRAR